MKDLRLLVLSHSVVTNCQVEKRLFSDPFTCKELHTGLVLLIVQISIYVWKYFGNIIENGGTIHFP